MHDLNETRQMQSGGTVTVTWAENRKSAQVTLPDGTFLDVIYQVRSGKTLHWYAYSDAETSYQSAEYALAGVIGKASGTMKTGTLL